MSNIYGILEKESRKVELGDGEKLDCSILVGSVKDPLEFVDVVVTKGNKDFKMTIRVHGESEFMLCAEKKDDTVLVKSMAEELMDWLIGCEYKDMFLVLKELKELEATLSSYLEDLYRIQE